MIRDYKFDNKLADRPQKNRGRIGIYLASSVLASVLVALGLHDTEATSPSGGITTQLPLVASTIDGPGKPVPISAPLALPGQHSEATQDMPHRESVSAAASKHATPSLLGEAKPLPEDKPSRSAELLPAVDPAPAHITSLLTTTPVAPIPVAPIEEPPVTVTDAQATSNTKPLVLAKAIAPATPLKAEPTEIKTAASWKAHQIAKGETLAGIFKQFQLSATTVYRVLHAGKDAETLSRIRPGQQLKLQIDPAGKLNQLVFVKSPIESLHINRNGDKFKAHLDNKKVEHKVASVTGTIESSLFLDGQKAGLTDTQIMELAEIFGWDIDFALEIRAGDQFRVIYDEQFVDGEKYRNGPIIAAEFVNRGRTYQAFRYETKDAISYYDADGHSKRRAFIRTPIRFARISSRFTPKRWHPVLKKWKSHKGVDYAAPRGTPIKATGNGRVVFRGWQRGYGRVVMIQHGGKYKTVYAHMSKFRGSVKKGSRVQQGQVIGYVGKSGWATGPHLHYEFRVNNVQRNPLTVKLPKSLALPKRQLAAFKRKIAPLSHQLASVRQATMVARADD